MVVPPDVPTCFIKGIIRDVQFEEEYYEPCLKGIPYPPGVMPGTTRPAQYRLTVLIQEVSFISVRVKTCEERYVLDSEDVFFIYKTDVKKDFIEEGQVIEGQVWNGFFRSYTLSGNSQQKNKGNGCSQDDIT